MKSASRYGSSATPLLRNGARFFMFSAAKTIVASLCLVLALPVFAESFLFAGLSGLVGPFEGLDAGGYAFLVEKLGMVGPIPLCAYWSSYDPSPQGLLGPGWHIPLLESRIVQVDEKTYEFLQPDGLKRDIRVSRDNAEVLTSTRVWTGRAKGDKISLQADVGGNERYTLSFRQGRLVKMQVEEGTFDFVYAGRVADKINSKGKNLFAVVRDSRNPAKFDFLFAGGERVGFERVADVLTISWPDGRRKTFAKRSSGMEDTMKVDQLEIGWNRYTKKLASCDGWRYTFGEVKPEWNNPPIDRLNHDGRREHYWFNVANGRGEYRMSDGTVYRWARFPSGDHYGLMRWAEKKRNKELLHRNDYSYDSARRVVYNRFARGEAERADGALPALEERWYSEDGKVRRVRMDGKDATP